MADFPGQGEIDLIATQILFDAKEAISSLKGWNLSVTEAADKIKLFKELIKSTAAQVNGDMKLATAAVQRFSSALGINPSVVAKIGKDLQTIDAIAQKSLGDISSKSLESSARMTLLSNAIQAMAKTGKVSIDQVVASLRTLNSSTGTKFGKLGFSDQDIAKSGEAAKQAAKEVENVGKASQATGEKATSAFGRVFSSVNALRIALGALVSMVLFQVIQAIQQLGSDSVKQFTEMEDALWRIVNVERELSRAGLEVSVEGLKKGIQDIKALLPIFSEQDISGLVGKVAISTKALGYNEKQILDLAKAIGVLNVRSTENEDLNQTASKVITALLSGTTKGVSGLGVQLNDTAIKVKAVEMGFLKATEGIDKLNTEQKNLVKLQVILDGTAGELGSIGDYLDTNAAKLKENSAAWDDLKTAAGGFTSTIIPSLTGIIKFLTDAVNMFKVWFAVSEAVRNSIVGIFKAYLSGTNLVDAVKKGIVAIKDIPKVFDQTFKDQIPNLFATMPANAPKWFKDVFGKYLTDAETATNATKTFKDELEDNEDVLKALDAIDQKVQEIKLDAQQAQQDLDLKLSQKQADLDLEYKRKNEDAAKDHAQKLEDINRDSLQKIDDAKAKSREEEKKAEKDLAQKLKELRDRYLLDLEEALHNRDARQVLHLMKEYELDKEHILNQKKQDDQARKDKLAADLKAIEDEKQRRIEAENLEYQRKLEDLNTAKAREQDDLKTWYKREQDDIQRNIKEKLEKLVAGYIAEGKIHETEQAKIYAILQKWFGKDTALTGQLSQFMADQFAQVQNMALASAGLLAPVGSLNYALGAAQNTNPFSGHLASPIPNMTSNGTYAGGLAEGGTFVATRPTMAIFGERGAEIASFQPLNRSGTDTNKVFGDIGGGTGVNGTISVNVDLSPDLEARVIQRSMDGVGQVVSRVNRKKL